MSDYEFLLPDVGEGLREGEVVKWHVAPGDTVDVDQIIVDVQTDKAIVEIPSPVSGTIVRLGGEPNDVLPIGAVLAVIATGGATSAPSGQSPEAPAGSIEAPQAPAPGSGPPRAGGRSLVTAAPTRYRHARFTRARGRSGVEAGGPGAREPGHAQAGAHARHRSDADSRHRIARTNHAGRRGTVRGTREGAGGGERAASRTGVRRCANRRDAAGARGPCAGG